MERTPEYYLTKGLDMVVNGVAAVIFYAASPMPVMRCGTTGAS